MPSEGARPFRHMGSIEDPSVHEPPEDSEEPAADAAAPPPGDRLPGNRPSGAMEGAASETIGTAVSANAEADPLDDSVAETPFKRSGHPVRDRLLAKAWAAHQETGPVVAPPAGEALGKMERQLREVATVGRRKRSPLQVEGARLSSASVLLLGTVFGLAAFALFFALLFEFLPRHSAEAPPAEATAAAPAQLEPTASAPVELAAPPPRKRLPGPWRIEQAKPGERILRGHIGKDPFLRAIQVAGLDKTQAYRVYTALKGEKNLDRCRPSDEFVALLDKSDGRVLAFEYIESREEVYQARQGADGLLVGKTLDLEVRRGRVQGGITVRSSSFGENATAAHFDAGLGVIINKALEGHLTVEDFQRGDRLRVVAQEVTVLGEFSRYSGLEALEYVPQQGEPIRVYYFENNKRYYDAKGRAPGEGGWRKPVPGAPITSRFNPTRMHPILKKVMPHNGTDFGAPTGTPIFAASSGKIVKLGNYGANGNYIALEHRGGYQTGYSHLSRFEPGLEVGDTVKRLQPIGYVGSTGRSTGPHLHFSAKKDGKYIDPESLGLDRLTALPKDELALFQRVKQKYDELLEAIPLPPPIVVDTPAEAPPEVDSHFDEFEGAPTGEPAAASPAVVEAARTPAPEAPREAAPVENVQPEPPRATATPPRRSSLYLTDQELMQSQAAQSDGEVEE